MKLKIKVKPKISYYVSIIVCCVILIYFAYKGIVAYIIHRELYGGGLDTLVLLRGIFIGWTSVFIILIVLNLSSIYFIVLAAIVSFFSLITLFSLEDQIKEEKNTLTEKEIYLLQQLAKKK